MLDAITYGKDCIRASMDVTATVYSIPRTISVLHLRTSGNFAQKGSKNGCEWAKLVWTHLHPGSCPLSTLE